MQRNILLIPVLVMLLVSSCSKEDLVQDTQLSGQDPLSRTQINQRIEQHLQSQNTVFDWRISDDQLLWSAVVRSDSTVVIGYKPGDIANIDRQIHAIDLQDRQWLSARNTILGIARRAHPELTDDELVLSIDPVLPILSLRLFDRTALQQLRQLDEVRYLEPRSYDPAELSLRSDSGCSAPPVSNLPPEDYTTLSPDVKVPWNFQHANIPAAWQNASGDGIKVAIIDTGTSPNQSKLGSEFDSGQSSGRSITRRGTYVSSWWWWASPDGPDDRCGHGTQMAGLLAAPRGSGGSTVGVAYGADLLAIRGTGDVVVNESNEKNGVKDALVMAGNDRKVKIISMSIGDAFYSGTVADGINYAYNKGKLIFAAAGTSLSWTTWWGVVFPASMNETVAVTGVTDAASLQRCNSCHSGSEVDFVAVMQRAGLSDRVSLTLAMSGNDPAYIGGSSAATAITAGIAALVWSTRPSLSRSKVLTKLKKAASHYPNRHSEFGWGLIDAAAAVE